MGISLFVWLVCSLAVDGLISKVPLQTRTCVLDSFTTDKLFRGLDEIKSDVNSTLCGYEHKNCAVFGHPV